MKKEESDSLIGLSKAGAGLGRNPRRLSRLRSARMDNRSPRWTAPENFISYLWRRPRSGEAEELQQRAIGSHWPSICVRGQPSLPRSILPNDFCLFVGQISASFSMLLVALKCDSASETTL